MVSRYKLNLVGLIWRFPKGAVIKAGLHVSQGSEETPGLYWQFNFVSQMVSTNTEALFVGMRLPVVYIQWKGKGPRCEF